jgi:hypothetical protein
MTGVAPEQVFSFRIWRIFQRSGCGSAGRLSVERRNAAETETTKLLVVLIADYEARYFPIERVSGVEVPKD